MTQLSRSPREIAANLRAARFDVGEMSGALGDLGTFLPLLLAMSACGAIDFTTSLLFAGICTLATGFLFRIPMPVQPMKAIATIAIAQGLSVAQVAAAGAIVGSVTMLVGCVGLADRIGRWLPQSVVRGLQLALAGTLAWKGFELVTRTSAWWTLDGRAIAIVALVLVLLLASSRRWPIAAILFAFGLVVAATSLPADSRIAGVHQPAFAFVIPDIVNLDGASWRSAWLAAAPQMPLTLLNSVVAICALSATLFPHAAASPRRVAVSVGVMNLAGACFGAMPLCHGAGGLAAQYRFGARTNGSILMLGSAKVVLALAFGAALVPLCNAFPASILGVMLFVPAIELGRIALARASTRELSITIVTGAASLWLGMSWGCAIGLVAALALLPRRTA
ncbi:MAG: putative sulfate/molybdate transporter [Phycisphaerae bacterium]|nr:putative sulfate/molybdate transporter [Phycisphaerae bacterium]